MKENSNEIEKKLDELYKKKNDIDNQIYRLNNLKVDKLHNDGKKNIGRCFKKNNKNAYVKIVDAPVIEDSIRGRSINQYQYPALFMYPEMKFPFEMDFMFLRNCKNRDDEWEEISLKEYDTIFEKVCENWKNTVIQLKKGR